MIKENLLKIQERLPADYYDRSIRENILQRIYHQRRFKEVIELIDKTQGRLLDVGCDGGTFTGEIKKARPGLEILGIDVNSQAIEYAKRKHPNINFLVADASQLPFEDEEFDIICCFEVLEHVEDPSLVIKEAWRCLKKDGDFIVLVPTENWLFRILWFFWLKIKGKVWEGAHLHKFPGLSLDNLLKQAGFMILERKTFNLGMLLAIKAKK